MTASGWRNGRVIENGVFRNGTKRHINKNKLHLEACIFKIACAKMHLQRTS